MEMPLPNQSYIDGLQTNDIHLLESLISAGQPMAVAAIRAEGGSQADGELMFQVAILELANSIHTNALPEGLPLLNHLEELALAHYIDWREERGVTGGKSDLSKFPENAVPTSEQLRHTRRQYVAWSKYARLTPECQTTLRSELGWANYRPVDIEDKTVHSEAFFDGVARYRDLLGTSATEGVVENGLPTWATEAVLDEKGYDLWQKIQQVIKSTAEQRIVVQQKKQTRRNWAVVGTLVGIVLLAWLYNWWTRPVAVVIYKDNFAPPESMVADMQARYSQLAADDSTTVHTADCEQLFRVADEFYQKKEYGQAAEELENLLDENEQSPCQSDALFYLGIIGLQLDQPTYTLSNFAKIEDLAHFGEDIYWYQAMAFVKMAEKQPETKERAARSLERAIGNIQDSVRRGQAQKMLEKLSK